jgi:hypothetical protein
MLSDCHFTLGEDVIARGSRRTLGLPLWDRTNLAPLARRLRTAAVFQPNLDRVIMVMVLAGVGAELAQRSSKSTRDAPSALIPTCVHQTRLLSMNRHPHAALALWERVPGGRVRENCSARMTEWIKKNGHKPRNQLMRTLRAKLRGTWNYYGLIGNSERMQLFYTLTCRTVFKWLNRRSQKRSLTWKAFNRLLSRFEVPQPHIVESNARRQPCQLELSFFDRVASFLTRLRPVGACQAS